MANFEYKYIYLKLDENTYKEIMISDVDFKYIDFYNKNNWNAGQTVAGNGLLAFAPLDKTSLIYFRGVGDAFDKLIPIYTRGNGLDYVDTGFSLFITYNGVEEGVKQHTSLILYKDNSIIQTYNFDAGNFNLFFASTYDSERQIDTVRLVTYDVDNDHFVARYIVNEDFTSYLINVKSTNPDKRYYEYKAPTSGYNLKSTNFIISEIPELSQQTAGWVVSDNNYLKKNGNDEKNWVVTSVGVPDVVYENIRLQNNKFNTYYNSGAKPKLGSNILYYHENYWETGLRYYNDNYYMGDNQSYNIVSGRIRIYVNTTPNQDNECEIKFYVDGILRDTFNFKTAKSYEYWGSAYTWAGNHKTDSLFIGKGNYGDYYIFGRTCDTTSITDGDGTTIGSPYYVKLLKTLSSYTRDALDEQTTSEGSAEGYDSVGSELANNNTSERGIDDEGNEGTWVDTDNDGVVDTFVSDRFKTGAGARGDSDGNKDLAYGDSPIRPPTTPIGEPSSSKLVNTFALTQSQLNDFANELMSPSAWRKMKDFFSVNPLDGVYSLHMLPYTVPTSTPKNVQIADWKSNNTYPVCSSSYKMMDFGVVTLKETYPTMEFLNYTDVSIKIFLPLIGFKEVDPTLVIGIPTNLKYYCNLLTGDILAVLMCDDKPLYNWVGNCCMKIPLSKNDYSQAISSGINVVTSLGTSAVGFATGNPMLGVSGLVSAGDSFVKATKPNILTSGALSGNASMFTSKQPFYIVSRNTLAFDKEFNHDFGRHTYKRKTIGDLKGYTKIVDVDLDNLTCTEQEKDEIRNLLREGVYV